MEFIPTVDSEKLSFASSTLVLPIVSTGNVAQLAVDLLIASRGLRRVGILDAQDLFSVTGAREDGETGVTTPLEIFGKEGGSFYVIQQRSPVLKARKEHFISSFLDFVQQQKFGSLLVLSGVDVSIRSDQQMQNPTYHYVPVKAPSLAAPLSSISTIVPPYSAPTQLDLPASGEHAQGQDSGVPFMPGSGLTRRLLSSLPPTLPAAALLEFVLEGDNRADAQMLASVVAKVLGLENVEWKEPSSWRQGLFGTPHDQTLFG
ncbi:hypothetical protein BOTBODRAFT_25969 [Botryobasidium botryosum FD-172 SS1]|uniref:Proteasome assembly chaperone 2 n=1 Tax=Botryobasidium botryosum (strain FD-172 SS1) TaxID=930990 RepID=A0A067NCL1_BOTB1|nr:hypothetical protein BOTBODRAFT_25969 [Botryobasidium botryosum FD-172 SS1]